MPTKKALPPSPGSSSVTVNLKAVEWLGHESAMSSLPIDVKRGGGYALHFVQVGEDPPNWSSMETIGSGAKEIRLQDAQGWYRIFYVAKLSEAIFILGVITKKTNTTSQSDIDNARQKYKDAVKKNSDLKAISEQKAQATTSKSKREKK
ncbi:hypothetical protein CR152_15775 [Massilia violaceinigra]|uniref:Addiction module toxin RelE n=1 Tax=Massilia violaceinigra TaxID=2045208 RepID=A0A2D2DLH3_9BURK|nr:type II toxin-antitoxin system RelE/ParE family toxin [Massilia violaceinigra]ATQ75823.1 hypothetical protein CR152_15775 [Massilia violaceinigra]